MKRWNTLARVTTPDRNTLTLSEHDGEYVLRVNGRELMSNRRHASELRLGELGGLMARKVSRARILIGGLGLGFTLRGALKAAPGDTEVIVAELMPEVVAWNMNATWPLGADLIADRRTKVVTGDVFALIAAASKDPTQAFDAILLDADNGTTAMMSAGNRKLYVEAGIRRVFHALRPGGLAVWWSATPEPHLAKLLHKMGFRVDVESVRSYGAGGAWHTLVTARKPAGEAPVAGPPAAPHQKTLAPTRRPR